MRKIIILLSLVLSLYSDDIVVYTNEYNILKLDKKVKKLIVGNKEMINVSLLSSSQAEGTLVKIFGKSIGNTSILVMYRDGTLNNYHVYVNENLGFIQKMINYIEPNLVVSRIGNGSTVISGEFKDPHDKKRIYALLENAGIEMSKLMDLTETKNVNKMIRTKLYLVEINNKKAKELGGVTKLGFFDKYLNMAVNPSSLTGATFSGWLLDNTASFTSARGTSVTGTLNFLEESGLGTILDDTVLMTTEDENASFRVGGEVYIPIGMTQNTGVAPTIQLAEREYGLRLILTTKFMEKDGFMHINIDIKDSEFDTNRDHDVQLGSDIVVPSFISKNMKTRVVVKSGQVIALGGRLHSEDVDNEEKIPLLGDIPVLGKAFTRTETSTKNNDLLFFLVPEIVDANEKVDDMNFYKDFKGSGLTFHKEILDVNSVKLEQKDDAIKALTNQEVAEDELMVIELEEDASSTNNSSSKEDVVEDITNENSKPIEQEVEIKDDIYKVSVGKVFLRESPVDGKRNSVWIKGHQFTVSQEKVIGSDAWLRVKEDCLNSCQTVNEEHWISKKFAELI